MLSAIVQHKFVEKNNGKEFNSRQKEKKHSHHNSVAVVLQCLTGTG